MKKLITLAIGDLRNILRDYILLLSMCGPLLLALFVRFAVPWLAELLQIKFGFDLMVHYPFIVSFMLLLTPMLIGMLMGFIILDERDQDVLTYLMVTPLSRAGYLTYRLISPMIISFILSFVTLGFATLEGLDYLTVAPVVVMSALEAPMMALFLVAFAQNKVEGLALGKAAGILFLAPIGGYMITSNWQMALGLFPTYWIPISFLESLNSVGAYLIYLIMGFVVHLLVISLLYQKFKTKI